MYGKLDGIDYNEYADKEKYHQEPHKDKYYCTDLITRSLYKFGIDLNYDNFFAIGNDLILSDETYLIFYIECDSEGVFSVYYLSEE